LEEFDFVSKLLQGLSFIPAVVNRIEGLLGNRPGEEKKEDGRALVS
jgi:hypothetical protein